MGARAIHLNLLNENEIVSSSPIRIRVMMPVAAMLATAAMVLWWVIVYGAVILNRTSLSSLASDIEAKTASHRQMLKQMEEAEELEAELEQLEYYRSGRREWGDTFAHFAEIVPLKVQITRISIPVPPPQELRKTEKLKSGKKKVSTLWGPKEPGEKVRLVLSGRTTKETPVISMMESLESDVFTNSLVICRDPAAPEQSPRVKSFHQDNATGDHASGRQRLLAFEIEYTAKERRFAK